MADPPPAPPRPRLTPVSAPFWEALTDDRLVLQRCSRCGTWIHYPRLRCPRCLSDHLGWEEVPARGTIYAMTVARTPAAAPFSSEVPQAIAVVELAQGVRLTSTIIGAQGLLPVGTPVRGVFEHGPDGVTMLRFVPDPAPGRGDSSGEDP